MQHVDAQSAEAQIPQHLANAVYATARLRKQPAVGELQLLVQTYVRPEVLANAVPRASANIAWAVGKLSQSPGWQGGVSEQDVQQLLGEQQLQVLAGTPKDVLNVLIALAYLAAGDTPLIGRTFAQQSGGQLLSLASTPVSSWEPLQIANTMWATAELGLPAAAFVLKAVQTARFWAPISSDIELSQVAQACVLLQYKDEALASLVLQRASRLVQHQQQPDKPRRNSRVLSAADKANLAAALAASVAHLDMQRLAGAARDLVAASRVGQQAQTHPSNLRRLWLFHAWLLQHQLLDGRGLTGLVTQKQLRLGQEKAAEYGTGLTVSKGGSGVSPD